ncbi:MAG: DUF3052 family protein [Deltaproteobacteria bacterium]|nr:DUF3052 family protein [Deltaproteobacteria bacterium]
MIRYPRSRSEKLGLKPGQKVSILGVDDKGFLSEVEALAEDTTVGVPGKDRDLVFFAARDRADLERLGRLRRAIADDGAIWALWPKGRKELREDDVRQAALANGLVDVKVVAFSDVLSGLKLVVRRADRRAARRASAATRSTRRAGPRPAIPPDLEAALARSTRARAAFDRQPPSHQREYIGYVDEAKRPQTRARRIAETIEHLEVDAHDPAKRSEGDTRYPAKRSEGDTHYPAKRSEGDTHYPAKRP